MDTTIEQRSMVDYKHVTSNILNQLEGSPLLTALNNAGVFDISDLISLTGQQVHSLSYDDNGTMRPVPVAPRNRVITFVAYINYRNNHGTPIGNDYLSVTADQYDNFRCTEYLRSGNSDLSYPDVTAGIMLKGINHDPVTDFLEDIPHASSLSPIVCNHAKDDTATLTDNPETPTAQEESIGAENIEEEGPGHGTEKENVPCEPEQPDLRKRASLAMKEHNKTDHYKEYKPKIFLVEKLWQPEPPPPEPPPHHL